MTRIVTGVRIARPMATVYDYVTRPANWPAWHPASLSVEGDADHSLEMGETVVERFRAAGRRGEATWRVVGRNPPQLWAIATATPAGEAVIVYRLRREAGLTVFERQLNYTVRGRWLGLLDVLFIRRRMARESRRALDRLKAVLEAAPDGRGLVRRHPDRPA